MACVLSVNQQTAMWLRWTKHKNKTRFCVTMVKY